MTSLHWLGVWLGQTHLCTLLCSPQPQGTWLLKVLLLEEGSFQKPVEADIKVEDSGQVRRSLGHLVVVGGQDSMAGYWDAV